MKAAPAKRILFALFAFPILQACGPAGAGLFRGDRVNVDRDYIHLDDPFFLQTESVYGHRLDGWFAFQLPIFFNADRQDTLRFGPGCATVSTAARTPQARVSHPFRADDSTGKSESGASSRTEGRRRLSCLVDTGKALTDSAAIAERFRDSAWSLELAPKRAGNTKVDLNFYCREYNPLRGGTDTLFVTFRKKHGGAEPKDLAISLPFHVSYRGPLVSILIGLGLLYVFVQVGLIISDS